MSRLDPISEKIFHNQFYHNLKPGLFWVKKHVSYNFYYLKWETVPWSLKSLDKKYPDVLETFFPLHFLSFQIVFVSYLRKPIPRVFIRQINSHFNERKPSSQEKGLYRGGGAPSFIRSCGWEANNNLNIWIWTSICK